MTGEVDRLNEKNVVSAMSQNRWLVEVSERLFDIFEDEEWVDEEVREQMESISEFSDQVWQKYHASDGYDVEAIQSMDPGDHPELQEELDRNTTQEVQTELARTLDRHAGEALNYTRELLDQLEGNEDVVDDLETATEAIRGAIEESMAGYPAADVDINYEVLAEHVEGEFDYAEMASELNPERMATYIASEMNVEYERIASEIDVDEEEVARYIDEKEIADALDESRLAQEIEVSAIDQEFYEAMFDFADRVGQGAKTAEEAYEELLDRYESAVESYESLGGDVEDFIETFGEKRRQINSSVESLEQTVEQSQSRVEELDRRMQGVKDRLGR
jgi:chromosome segregation ATPase